MSDSESDFLSQVAEQNSGKPALAIALLWYRDQLDKGASLTAKEIVTILHAYGHIAAGNFQRMATNLATPRNGVTQKGGVKGSFTLSHELRVKLNTEYSPLIGKKLIKLTNDLLPVVIVGTEHPALQSAIHQINGCFECGYYDACCVMMRRVVEILLIQAFLKNGGKKLIFKNGNYLGLEDIIGQAENKTTCPFSVTRQSIPTLRSIKLLGDTAAHNPHVTKGIQDIDHDFKIRLRNVIAELIVHAKITQVL